MGVTATAADSMPPGIPPGPDQDRLVAAAAEQARRKGFLLTKYDELVSWARTGSLWPMTFGLACCAIEMIQAYMPRYDLDRLGVIPRPSPRRVACRATGASGLLNRRSWRRWCLANPRR